MKLLNNSKLVVTIIILLLLSNIVLITIVFLRDKAPFQPQRHNVDSAWKHQKDKCQDEHPLVGKLNFNEEQKEIFEQSRNKFRSNTRAIVDSLSGIRKQMLDVLNETPTDTTKIYALADEVGLLHAQLKRQTAFHYLEIKDVCNPEQQKLLNDFFKDIRYGSRYMKRKHFDNKNRN